MSEERKSRWLLHSRDGGRTWEVCEAIKGSVVYASVKPGQVYDDGYGNLYREIGSEP